MALNPFCDETLHLVIGVGEVQAIVKKKNNNNKKKKKKKGGGGSLMDVASGFMQFKGGGGAGCLGPYMLRIITWKSPPPPSSPPSLPKTNSYS